MKKIVFIVIICVLFSACSRTVQTTSGGSYLEKYKSQVTASAPPLRSFSGNRGNEDSVEAISLTEKILEVAAVEPTLTFPARVGIARIERGELTVIPEKEAEDWKKMQDNLGNNFGQLIPVNPLIANMVASSVGLESRNRMNNVIQKIRFGAARQHLDVVLIYEVYSKNDMDRNILAITDLTIVAGYFMPSRKVEAEGFANSMLIDVIQGYPYGTANIALEKEEMTTTLWGSDDTEEELSEQVKARAAQKLTEEVEKMFFELRLELAEKRAQNN